MRRRKSRRNVDFQIISDWVEPGSRVLDLGCGRGVLLQHLMEHKQAWVVGVDMDSDKVLGCISKGVSIFQGDALAVMRQFPDGFFDRVICSRTVEELEDPRATLLESLRVGRRLTVGFVNYGYWRNRVSFLWQGRRIRNEVFPEPWYDRRPANPFSLPEFEAFCAVSGIRIQRRELLGSDWDSECRFLPSLFTGYALFDLSREGTEKNNGA